ncbi:MAG: type II toxin-antitoxin system HicA family toxin [Sporomusaceae bacterium]|jgi:predicted RNA binding protein YcfA (HicA-like mRNA interferase family)|nr:type II toxin-antitoxin system HicA family toxin [Sporomusaceae bacterium]
MKNYSSREIIQLLQNDGWYISDITGSHHQFKHPIKPGKTTVPHPKKDLPQETAKNIQSGRA